MKRIILAMVLSWLMNPVFGFPQYPQFTQYVFEGDYYDTFEEIVIKMRYSLQGHEGRVDRNFIRKNIR